MSWWDDAIGRSAQITRVFTVEDLRDYDALAGEASPSERVPEPLIAGLFSTLLGVHLPGPGTNYLKQTMRFPGGAAAGEPLIATVEITSVRPEKRLVRLATRCTDEDGGLICHGEALVLAGGIAAEAVPDGSAPDANENDKEEVSGR